ncbi:MAG TPA: PA14 domain-containing protein, partial [Acidobacteriaceae bacterium]
VSNGAQQPTFLKADNSMRAAFQVSPPVLEPGTRAIFTADNSTNPRVKYTWLFGDGASATGQEVRHIFPDAMGTQLNGPSSKSPNQNGAGAGRFRVILHADDGHGHEDWAAQDIVVIGRWNNAATDVSGKGATAPGLAYNIYPGTWPELPSFKTEAAIRNGIAGHLGATESGGFTRYAVVYEGLLEAPADGGYTFHLLSRDGARLFIDGQLISQTGPPFAEVCGSPINAVRDALGSAGLRAGKHELRIESLQTMSPVSPRLQWSGPGVSLVDVPAAAFSHRTVATMHAAAPVPINSAGPNTAAATAAAAPPH